MMGENLVVFYKQRLRKEHKQAFFAAFFMLPMPSPWFTLSALVVFTRLFFISTGCEIYPKEENND